MLPRENETQPTLHDDEAADVVLILLEEANRTAQALSNAYGADRWAEVERWGKWLTRVMALLTAFGRSDLAKKFSAIGKPAQEKQ
jgi:hypothetical protein